MRQAAKTQRRRPPRTPCSLSKKIFVLSGPVAVLRGIVAPIKREAMEQFTSGWKRSYYGKGDVIVYRLNRDANTPDGASPVFGASVLMLVYGDAFWATYTTGDNTGLVATDSMKNFIQRETMVFEGYDLEGLCSFLGRTFLATYPHTEGIHVTA